MKREVVDSSVVRTSLARSGPERKAGRLSEGARRGPTDNQTPLPGAEMPANVRRGTLS